MKDLEIDMLLSGLADTAERSAALQADVKRLEEMLKAVKGTRDVVAQAHEAREQLLAPPVRDTHRMFNAGFADKPAWFPIIGDNAPTAELAELIKSLLNERPFSLQDLMKATGARASRVNGVLIAMQRSGDGLMNLGNGRWFLPPAKARIVNLSLKTKNTTPQYNLARVALKPQQ